MKLFVFNIIFSKEDGVDILANPSQTPLAYYWNDEDDKEIYNVLIEDNKFKEYIIDTCFTVERYVSSKIAYVMYNEENTKEPCKEEIINISEIYKLNESTTLCYDYILSIFKYLYKYSIKNSYVERFENSIDNILDIYNILKDKYNSKINPLTVKEYVRSQLQQKYSLSKENIDIILDVYDGLIL